MCVRKLTHCFHLDLSVVSVRSLCILGHQVKRFSEASDKKSETFSVVSMSRGRHVFIKRLRVPWPAIND